MDHTEGQLHSFIIRLRVYEAADDDKVVRWRGRITHLPTQQRRYVQTLAEINKFIDEYLRQSTIPRHP